MKWYLIPLALISLSFVLGTLVPSDITELPCDGCKASAYAKLDYGSGNLWIDPDVQQDYGFAGVMNITNITGPEADGECHCHYEREDAGSPWVLSSSCHEKKSCTASITVEADPLGTAVHVDIDGGETGGGVTASATVTATGCGDPTVTKTIKFENIFGADLGGVTVNASCGACGSSCPVPPVGGGS